MNIIKATVILLCLAENTRLQACQRRCEQLKRSMCQSNGGHQAPFTMCNKQGEIMRSSITACYDHCENVGKPGKRGGKVGGLP